MAKNRYATFSGLNALTCCRALVTPAVVDRLSELSGRFGAGDLHFKVARWLRLALSM